MSIPPIVVYAVLAAFGIGLLSPLMVACWGQRDRPGARIGIILGTTLSIPAGLLTGTILWSYLEEASSMGAGISLFVGPVVGCFVGTLIVSLLMREVGVGIAAARKSHTEIVGQCKG